jgi:uncharacterized protein
MEVEQLQRGHLVGLVNVAQLLSGPVGSSRDYDIGSIIKGQSKDFIDGVVTLIYTNQGILVRGKLSARVELVCSRCLKVFPYRLNFNVEQEFLTAASEESEGFTIDNNHILDLGELIRQYILLNLPMKPLCRPDCAGMKEMKLYGST